jgi:hypothetical protein
MPPADGAVPTRRGAGARFAVGKRAPAIVEAREAGYDHHDREGGQAVMATQKQREAARKNVKKAQAGVREKRRGLELG